MTVTHRPSIYDRLKPHLDASDLIARLGIQLVRTVGSEAYCKPLCHESASGESLQVNLHTGRWNCKACQTSGMYGDLIQLVEYVQTGGGAPSRGNAQGASIAHRSALIWLCEQYGVPFDSARATGDAGLDVVHLFAMAAHEYLLGQPDVLAWIAEKWGFDLSTVEAYGIGFMPDPILPEIAVEASRAASRDAFRASGLGWFTADGAWKTRFAGRVTFPYLEHGRAVYLIGRATPWTPALDNGAKPPKYHKLSVHSAERPYISERVTNDHLYNEPVMASADVVVIAEGVADAVALSALGVSVVSPVTISFNAVDLERFVRKSREFGIKRVEILFDNELSGSGNWAARRAGVQLMEHGLAAKVITLPLGESQVRARQEVISALGAEAFEELERSDPRERKALIERTVPDEARRRWIQQHVEASKIDAAEWSALTGAGAPGKFDAIRREGRDVVDLELEELVKTLDESLDPSERADHFDSIVTLCAHVEDRLLREAYAGKIAKAAGAGVTKAEIAKRIADARRRIVKPRRQEEEEEERLDHEAVRRDLVLLPPETSNAQPAPAPTTRTLGPSNAPAAPLAPGARTQTDHERYAPARDAVAKAVEAKFGEEALGEYVAQTILRSMGYTPFRTPDELYLVRGSERVPLGLASPTPRFLTLLWLASGLTPKKASHRAYIAAATYFLERDARKVTDVSWSHVDASGAVYFPAGDESGRLVKIEAGRITRTKMSEARVPAVAGDEFRSFAYLEDEGGIQRALDLFRWTSLSASDRLVLVHWIVCLPILRRIGTVPIMRIEGGSSSGKTRTVDAVSYLVNGCKSSSVPTAAALVSRMSTEMLTIDDNRETADVTPAFLGTLLQATNLGAREKRKAHSDTGTVIERVCGALLMNGIEPIHDGRSELASRMITLRCSEQHRAPDSPTSDTALAEALVRNRDAFWSESIRRCSAALMLDRTYGEHIGKQIEAIFGATKIGRLSAYLRVMYLAWVAGLPLDRQGDVLQTFAGPWADAFQSIAEGSLESLLSEEMSVTVMRYVWAHCEQLAEPIYTGSDTVSAFGGKYAADRRHGDSYLGPIRATQLARIARAAGKDLNGPRVVSTDLRAGQLERRLLDGLAFLAAAGFEVNHEFTAGGKIRFTFRRQLELPPRTDLGAPQPPPMGQSAQAAADEFFRADQF